MSATTTASTSDSLPARSATVRTADVAGRLRRTTTSVVGSAARRRESPARAEMPHPTGTVTSMGSHGGRSSPCSQAAVRPENAASAGRRRSAAARTRAGPAVRPAHTYRPRPRRRQLEPWSCFRVSPTRSASRSVNGPFFSSAGTPARATRPSCARAPSATTHAVKRDECRETSPIRGRTRDECRHSWPLSRFSSPGTGRGPAGGPRSGFRSAGAGPSRSPSSPPGPRGRRGGPRRRRGP